MKYFLLRSAFFFFSTYFNLLRIVKPVRVIVSVGKCGYFGTEHGLCKFNRKAIPLSKR